MARAKVRVDFKELKQFAQRFQEVIDNNEIDAFMQECVFDLAKKLLKKVRQRTPVNTGLLRGRWEIGKITRKGNIYEVEVHNDVEYASYVENGFRAHWVPGYWSGKQFVYDPNAETGMHVGKPGGWVPGKFMMRFSVEEVERELPKFIKRKQKQFLNRIMRGR